MHLTLNAEYDRYRWGPITHAPSLLDGDGGFPRTVDDLWDHADLDEVRRELAAQIERAILWGFDVTHLDSHLGALQLRPEFFDIYLDLAVEFALPVRLSDASTERAIGFPFRNLAASEGVLFPDHFVPVGSIGSRQAIEQALADLQPGVTELQVRPALDTPEQRAFDDLWTHRVDDHHLLCFDTNLPQLLARSGVERIGYRALRSAPAGLVRQPGPAVGPVQSTAGQPASACTSGSGRSDGGGEQVEQHPRVAGDLGATPHEQGVRVRFALEQRHGVGERVGEGDVHVVGDPGLVGTAPSAMRAVYRSSPSGPPVMMRPMVAEPPWAANASAAGSQASSSQAVLR